MLRILMQTETEYIFTNEIERKVREYAEANHTDFKNAVYDLMNENELNINKYVCKKTVNKEINAVNVV